VSNTEIARRVGVSRPTALSWRNRYAAEGIGALDDRPRSGRPAGRIERKLRQVDGSRITRIIAAAPALTAALVLAVGIGIATRGLLQFV
jgi:transposase